MEKSGLARQQALYWKKMSDLRIAADYVRRYRDDCGHWMTVFGTVRAIASSASIAGWAIWHQLAFFWAVIIAGSQVLDALRKVFPVAKRHKAAGELTVTLDRLFIDAQLEWEGIFAGKYTEEQIAKRLHTLRTLHHQAECHCFPDGLPDREDFFRLAQDEAAAFFSETYKVNSLPGGDNDVEDQRQED